MFSDLIKLNIYSRGSCFYKLNNNNSLKYYISDAVAMFSFYDGFIGCVVASLAYDCVRMRKRNKCFQSRAMAKLRQTKKQLHEMHREIKNERCQRFTKVDIDKT